MENNDKTHNKERMKNYNKLLRISKIIVAVYYKLDNIRNLMTHSRLEYYEVKKIVQSTTKILPIK